MEGEQMDKREILRKLRPLAPVLSAVLVITCAGVSLYGYEAPVYAAKEPEQVVQTKEMQAKENEKAEEEIIEKVSGSYQLEDGVYHGTGIGFAGEIEVAVQIKAQTIVSIDILRASDDAAFFNRAKAVIDRIIENQNLEIDIVSGATYSSKGIISAVKNALTGEKDTTETGVSKQENTAIGSTPSIETVKEAETYKDGVYYGTGTGFGGTLKAKVEISGGKITSIQIVEHQDGSSYIQKASGLIAQIIASQSTNVDAVSGATYSSAGIIQAVRNALSQAAVTSSPENAQDSADAQETTGESTVVTGTIPYVEGIYYGTAEGYHGDITVAVVIQDNTMKAILVIAHEDDEAFFGRAMDVVKNVVKNQNTNVDTVSGATYSSTGLLNAIKNALTEAERVTNGEEPADTKINLSLLEETIAKAESLDKEDYTEASWAVVEIRLQDARAAMESKLQEVVDTAANNLNTAINSLKKIENEEEESVEDTVCRDGIYSGSAMCLPDEDEDFEPYQLFLKITVKNDKIVSVTDVEGDGDPSNDSFIKRAVNGTSSMPGVVTQIVEKGTMENIDVVSGATCSSKSILEACQNAWKEAMLQKEEESKEPTNEPADPEDMDGEVDENIETDQEREIE